jgi:hypothetical protein
LGFIHLPEAARATLKYERDGNQITERADTMFELHQAAIFKY